MADSKKLNMILGIIAALILIGSFSAFAYTHIPKGDPDVVVINNVEFTWDDVFTDYELHTFTSHDEQFEGISLEEIVLDSGVQSPETHTYRLTGLDGYQKDVAWINIQIGYLTPEEHRARFPDMTQSFSVRDLATIEVI